MPSRSSRSTRSSRRVAVLLTAATLGVFVLGEALLIARSDTGQLVLARVLGIGDQNQLTRIVSRQLRQGLAALQVPDDSLTMSVTSSGRARAVWRVGLTPETSLLRANYVLTRHAEKPGASVLSGRERTGEAGEAIVELVVGLPGRPTHQVLLVRQPPPEGESARRVSRLAVVIYGFGDDEQLASEFLALDAPFAMALAPGARSESPLIKAAHDRRREVVLHLPLEPINYPQVNPGPGTVLVTMRPSQISGLVRRYLHQSKPIVAVSNHMGSLATQDLTVMKAVFRELRGAGLPFVHVTPTAGAVCKDLAADLGVAYNEPAAMIDAEARQTSAAALDRRWSEILEEAAGREKMVVWVRATPLTLRWLVPALRRRMPEGVHVTSPSYVIRRPLVL